MDINMIDYKPGCTYLFTLKDKSLYAMFFYYNEFEKRAYVIKTNETMQPNGEVFSFDKDEFVSAVPATTVRDDSEISLGIDIYGIILFLKYDGGYIGPVYVEKGFGDQPRGNIRFERDLIGMEAFDYQCIHIVKCSVTLDAGGYMHATSIEIVQKIHRGDYQCVSVDPFTGRVTSKLYNEVPPICNGETIFIESASNKQQGLFEVVNIKNNKIITISDGTTINIFQQPITRFGKMSYNSETSGVLNDKYAVDLSIMTPKVKNIFVTAKKTLVIAYTMNGKVITKIDRVNDYIADIPWIPGTVETTYMGVDRYIDFHCDDGFARHYMNVETDGYICNLFKRNELNGKSVWVRCVSCRDLNNNPTTFVVEVRAADEPQLLVEYDEIHNKCVAARNLKKFAMAKPYEAKRFAGEQHDMTFLPNETGTVLLGYIADEVIDSGEGYEDGIAENNEDSFEGTDAILNSDLWKILSYRVTQGVPIQSFSQIYNAQEDKVNNLARCIAYIEEHPEATRRVLRFSKNFNGEIDRTTTSNLWYLFMLLYIKITKEKDFDTYELACIALTLNLYRDDEPTSCYKTLFHLLLPVFVEKTDISQVYKEIEDKTKEGSNILSNILKKQILNKNELLCHLIPIDGKSIGILKQCTEDYSALESVIADWYKNSELNISDITVDSNAWLILSALHTEYIRQKDVFSRKLKQVEHILSNEGSSLLDSLSEVFTQMIGQVDRNRIQRISNICHNVINASKTRINIQIETLQKCWNDFVQFKNEIITHPSWEVTWLWGLGVISDLEDELNKSLNALFSNDLYKPVFYCEAGDPTLAPDTSTITLLLYNSKENPDCQTAIKTSLSVDIPGVDVGMITPSSFDLKAGKENYRYVQIELGNVSPESMGNSFLLYWTVDFDYCNGFDMRPLIVHEQFDASKTPIEFQFSSSESLEKDITVINEYDVYKNIALKDGHMFFGRQKEKAEIYKHIFGTENSDTPYFLDSRTVILYGQKKCGKTSLVNQITNELRERSKEIQQAVILSFNSIRCQPGDLDFFENVLYLQILQNFARYVKKDADLNQLLLDNDIDITKFSGTKAESYDKTNARNDFERIVHTINEESSNHYHFVFVFDEFTRFCDLLDKRIEKNPEYIMIPRFIRDLADLGCTLIIIGHQNMYDFMERYKLFNSIGQFAKRINLSSLDDQASDALIREPMKRAWGIDPYDTPLGAKAIERLCECSGQNPYFLMRLCSRVFEYYRNNLQKIRLHSKDIERVIKEEVNELSLIEFDSMLLEDGDDGLVTYENLPTYKFLETVALRCIADDSHNCSCYTKCDSLSDEMNGITMNALEKRNILKVQEGRMWIQIGLFVDYIRSRYGYER